MYWDPATRYRLLLAINNAIITKTTREELFQTLAVELREHIAYARLSINLYDSKTQSLSYFAAAVGVAPAEISTPGQRPLTSAPIANMVLSNNSPVIIDDLSRYDHLSAVKGMIKTGLKATMAFPLKVRDRILGSIHFSFAQTPEHMSELIEVLQEISNQVAIAVDNMLNYVRLQNINENLEIQKRYLRASIDEPYSLENFFYCSHAMNALVEQIYLIATTDEPVLITGETGTGKDFLARHIHNMSSRADNLFIKVNCPALAPSLFESELFGHAKGAFTGADGKRVGRFELAEGGTIFLDEIGELPAALQAKLLHVLQDRQFERVGDSRSIKVNFRVISATNQDLEEAIRKKLFRQDLYYRLNTVPLHVPPLRERREDIPLLVEKLTMSESVRLNRPAPRFSKAAIQALCNYSWPGNVRELKNLVKRLLILRPGVRVTDGDIRNLLTPFDSTAEPFPTLVAIERRYLEQALIQCRGVISGPSGAAQLLGLPRSTLQYRLRKHGLRPQDYAETGQVRRTKTTS